MIGTELRTTLTAHAQQHIVAVGKAITDTSEEAHEMVIVLITAHTSLSFLEEFTNTNIVVFKEVTHKVGIVGIEALILVVLIAVSGQSLEAMLAPLVLVGRSHFQIVSLAVGVAVIGIPRVAVDDLIVVFRCVVALIMCIGTVGAHHQIGLPSFDGLNSDVAGQSRILSLILSRMLLEKSHRVHIVVDGHILVVAAISIVYRLSGIAHDGLAIDLRTCRIHRSVLMPVFDKIESDLHLIVEEPMGQVTREVHLVAIGIDEHTLLVAVSEISAVGSRIVAATDSEVVIVRKGRTCHGIQPVSVVALILEIGLTGTYITAVHHVELVAETGERQIT